MRLQCHGAKNKCKDEHNYASTSDALAFVF